MVCPIRVSGKGAGGAGSFLSYDLADSPGQKALRLDRSMIFRRTSFLTHVRFNIEAGVRRLADLISETQAASLKGSVKEGSQMSSVTQCDKDNTHLRSYGPNILDGYPSRRWAEDLS